MKKGGNMKNNQTSKVNRQKYLFFLCTWMCGLFSSLLLSGLFTSCNPNAKWATEDVHVDITIDAVSAGFIECQFETDKEAYYLIACEPVQEGINPMDYSKQFMMLAIDSANVEYLTWRNYLLRQGEFNIAPFASHALHYGSTHHFFTNLTYDTDYWVYAFAVNPETLEPAGKLKIVKVRTAPTSIYDVHFEYRVKGRWDYIYPLDDDGNINNHFPYLASTVDSLYLADELKETPEDYFENLFEITAQYGVEKVQYGVQVVKNDGINSDECFEEGHTYYTAIVSFDGWIGNNVIYQFTWTGDDFEAVFHDEDSIVGNGENE